MESDQIVAIELEAVAWDRRASTAIDHRRFELPEDVDAYSVQSYVERRFGEPLGTAHATPDGFDELVIGWTYPGTCMVELGMDHADATLLLVPFVRLGDGTRRELFVHNAEQRERFSALARELGAEMATVDGRRVYRPDRHEEPPAELHDRLENERLDLYHSDAAGIMLEIGGWLRRLLSEGHTYIIFELGESNRYVQFVTHDGSWLRGEVVGPTHLTDVRPLTDHELGSIRSIGWQEPETGSVIGNFWMEWGDPESGQPIDVDEAAAFAARTLCETFDLQAAHDVEIVTGPSRPGQLH